MIRTNRLAFTLSFLLPVATLTACDDGADPQPDESESLEAADPAIDSESEAVPGGDMVLENTTPEAQEFGWSNCLGTDRYPEHGVYDATIVYSIDEAVPPGEEVFLPMDEDRNTLEYRTAAYDFFSERYGADFDPNNPFPQVVVDEFGGQLLVQPTKTGPGDTSTHQVYGIDAQNIPQWRHKMPITNVAFRDDGFFVFALTDYIAHGTYGGEDGARIRGGDILVFGDYRMFDHKDRLLDTIHYQADTPATVNPFNGDEAASNGAQFVNITCAVSSEIFGEGLVRGLGEMRPLEDGSMDLDFRYVMRFPSRLEDASVNGRCRNIWPLWGW